MDEKLKNAFYQAYAGEAKAALRLNLYSKIAEDEGYSQIAKMFRVIAKSEEIHGQRSLMMLSKIGNTEENLAASFESETDLAETAYTEFIKLASELDNQLATNIFSQTRDVEEIHIKLYKEAMNHMMEERETTYHVCKICGYVSDGVLPDNCPVCGAGKDQFFEVD